MNRDDVILWLGVIGSIASILGLIFYVLEKKWPRSVFNLVSTLIKRVWDALVFILTVIWHVVWAVISGAFTEAVKAIVFIGLPESVAGFLVGVFLVGVISGGYFILLPLPNSPETKTITPSLTPTPTNTQTATVVSVVLNETPTPTYTPQTAPTWTLTPIPLPTWTPTFTPPPVSTWTPTPIVIVNPPTTRPTAIQASGGCQNNKGLPIECIHFNPPIPVEPAEGASVVPGSITFKWNPATDAQGNSENLASNEYFNLKLYHSEINEYGVEPFLSRSLELSVNFTEQKTMQGQLICGQVLWSIQVAFNTPNGEWGGFSSLESPKRLLVIDCDTPPDNGNGGGDPRD